IVYFALARALYFFLCTCGRKRSPNPIGTIWSRDMNKRLVLLVCSTVIFSGLAFSATPSFAQKKTVKACEEEWRANKAANEAAKITEKAYVAKCRADAEKPAA